jgi:hypothetical protein
MILSNTQSNVTNTAETKTKTPRKRFVLGKSECYFECADYMASNPKVNDKWVKKMILNSVTSDPITAICGSEGRSLKVMIRANEGKELKFIGFVTHGDAKHELDEEDVEGIIEAVMQDGVTKAVNAQDIIDMF